MITDLTAYRDGMSYLSRIAQAAYHRGRRPLSGRFRRWGVTQVSSAIAGWYPHPTGHYELRYWDGRTWALHVMDAGVPKIDERVHGPATAPVAVVTSSVATGADVAPAGLVERTRA